MEYIYQDGKKVGQLDRVTGLFWVKRKRSVHLMWKDLSYGFDKVFIDTNSPHIKNIKIIDSETKCELSIPKEQFLAVMVLHPPYKNFKEQYFCHLRYWSITDKNGAYLLPEVYLKLHKQ